MATHISGGSNTLSAPAHALTQAKLAAELSVDLHSGLFCVLKRTFVSRNAAVTKAQRSRKAPTSQDYRRSGSRRSASDNTFFALPEQQDGSFSHLKVLIMAMVVDFGIGPYIEAYVLAAVMLSNVVVGFFQKYSVQRP